MKTNQDVENQIHEKLNATLRELDVLPDGYHFSVRLRGKQRDKRRSASFGSSWSPDTDSIYIRFERASASEQSKQNVAPSKDAGLAVSSIPPLAEPIADLIRALDRVEGRPGYSFVALKWFRDAVLPSEGFAWAATDSTRQSVLRDAIDKRFVLTNKVPNPKSPEYPVTAIRLNRLMPEVKRVLGDRGEPAMLDFEPVPIRGGSLSTTVLNDRR